MLRRFALILFLTPLALAGCVDATSSNVPRKVGTSVGDIAPPLAGADLDDREVKLSDLRGKVVVVDFWATWCGPCRAMIPHEKSLVKRMQGRRFAFIGVSADRSRQTLKDFADKEELPWPNIYDGSSGQLVRDWDITYFPTIFVIDAEGVIRYKDVRGGQLESAVNKLVAEAESR